MSTALTTQPRQDRRAAVAAMNRRQRLALYRLWRYLRDDERHNGVTSVRYSVTPNGSSFSTTLETRRSDCHRASPRAVICHQYIHAFIGSRGGIQIATARCGFSGNRRERARHRSHVARMLRARTWGRA